MNPQMSHMTPGNYIPTEYLPVLLLMLTASAIGIGALVMGGIFRLRRPYKEKLMPYESGNPPVGEPRERFSVKYYIIAMLFIIFDIEGVFMIPWAVVFKRLGMFGLIEMGVFIAILLIGLAYVWKKGALEWE